MHMLPTAEDTALFLKRKSLRQTLYLNSTSVNGNDNGNGNSNPSKTTSGPSGKSMKKSKSKSFVLPHRQSSIPLSPARYMMLASASSSKNHNFKTNYNHNHNQNQTQKMNKMFKNVDHLQNHLMPMTMTTKKSKSSHKNNPNANARGSGANTNDNNNNNLPSSKSLCSTATTRNEIQFQISPVNNNNNNSNYIHTYQNIQHNNYSSNINSIILQAHKTCSSLKPDQSSPLISKNNRYNMKNPNDSINNLTPLTHPQHNNSPGTKNTNPNSNSNGSTSISTSSPRKGILKPSKTPACPAYPVFHNFQLCTAQPGTQEWKTYWDAYDQKLAEYKKSEQQYLEEHHEYRADLEKYKQEAARLQEQDFMFRKSIGLDQKKPSEVINHQLRGLTTVNGFVFDRSGGPGPSDGLNAILSSVGTSGFRLEIDVRGYDKDTVKIEKEYNLMKIQVPVNMDVNVNPLDPECGGRSRHKTIVIGVPSDHDLNDVEIYPIVNGWLVVELSPDKINTSKNITNTSLS